MTSQKEEENSAVDKHPFLLNWNIYDVPVYDDAMIRNFPLYQSS